MIAMGWSIVDAPRVEYIKLWQLVCGVVVVGSRFLHAERRSVLVSLGPGQRLLWHLQEGLQ